MNWIKNNRIVKNPVLSIGIFLAFIFPGIVIPLGLGKIFIPGNGLIFFAIFSFILGIILINNSNQNG